VDSTYLNSEQVERLRAIVGRDLRFLNRLCARMQRLAFPLDDPLCQAGLRARDVVQDLYTAIHYCGCKSGVGRPPNGSP
jgi:hypothetical protein